MCVLLDPAQGEAGACPEPCFGEAKARVKVRALMGYPVSGT